MQFVVGYRQGETQAYYATVVCLCTCISTSNVVTSIRTCTRRRRLLLLVLVTSLLVVVVVVAFVLVVLLYYYS